MQALARLLEIAASPAGDRELAAEAAAVAAFAWVTSPAGSPGTAARPRAVPRSRRLVKLALALAACVTALGGTAAAAGALPAPVQELAHVTFGAPAPHHGGPAPRPFGGSSRQPAHQRQAKQQPGHQQARLPGPKAHPKGTANSTAKSRQKAHGRKAHPHGQPGHHVIRPTGRPAKHPAVPLRGGR